MSNGAWGLFRLRGFLSKLRSQKYKARRSGDDEWTVMEETRCDEKRTCRITQQVLSDKEFRGSFAPVDQTAIRIIDRLRVGT